ncbi:MAG: hypothetical protein M3Z95_05980 [Actinomycetota bacterium]|nr:hypothetical protein [Actinomycetota bacterium]
MRGSSQLDLTLLPGARALLSIHERELPQRDDLCGAFCGALALRAAGIERQGAQELDQDTVALAAGSVVSALADPAGLPAGELGRRDYRLELPRVRDSAVCGTTAAGLVNAVQELAGGALAAIPYAGPWSADTLAGCFELVGALDHPITLIANLATRHLWGARPRLEELLDYLLEGVQRGPPADWDVGHFACVVGRVRGPAGSLYAIADTYPSLGSLGVHLQPQERLALALQRPDMPPGGMILIACAGDAPAVRSGAGALGLIEGLWDNGTVTVGRGK